LISVVERLLDEDLQLFKVFTDLKVALVSGKVGLLLC
jgi:hypothetical protein